MENFKKLLLVALGRASCLDRPFTAEEWDEIFSIAKKQALIGIMAKAMMQLPAEQMPSQKLKVRFAIIEDKVEERNALLISHIGKVAQRMKSVGLECCLLKGPGIASYYPVPEVRQSGDIDVWVLPEEHSNYFASRPSRRVPPIVRKLRHHWKVGDVVYHHADVYMFEDGTALEVHFMPTWMFNPRYNRRLQRYFDSRADRQFANYDSALGIAVPDLEFNCVYLLLHIFRHFLFEGVGMRQLMDYYYLLCSSDAQQRQRSYDLLCSIGLKRFCAGLMYTLKDYFALEEERMLCAPDRRLGRFLMHEVELAGNFGTFDPRNAVVSKDASLLFRISARIKHLSRFLRLSPREVLWGPFFKIWQSLWRFSNKY